MREAARAFVISDIVQATTLSREMRKYPARPFPATQKETPDAALPCFIISSQFTWQSFTYIC